MSSHWSDADQPQIQQQGVFPVDQIAAIDRELKDIGDEKKRRTLNKIETIFPDSGPFRRELYQRHLEFMRAGKYYRSRLFSAGNRCLVASSILELCGPLVGPTVERTVGELLWRGNHEQLLASWRDGKKAWEPASSIFLKGFGAAVRLRLSNGQYFDCGASHEILSGDGVTYRPAFDFMPGENTATGVSIESVEDLPDQIIVDLTVPRTNCYLSQGLVSHNCGKTVTGAYETTVHATGLYPHWWEGRQFNHAIAAWACGTSNETTKNVVQAELLGKIEKDDTISTDHIGVGTGMIPEHLIVGLEYHPQIRGAIKTAWIRHVSGKRSVIGFKSYEQGSTAYEGTAMDWIWLDESPDLAIYTECLMRTMTAAQGDGGELIITATPLNGLTELVQQFMPDGVIPETQVPV